MFKVIKVFESQMLPFKTRIYMARSNIILIGLRKRKKVMYTVYIVIQELKSYR